MGQVGIALTSRLKDHRHNAAGRGGSTLNPLLISKSIYGELGADELIDLAVVPSTLYSDSGNTGVKETMDHRYEGMKVTIPASLATVYMIEVMLTVSAPLTNNPGMTLKIYTDVAGSPGVLDETFDNVVYPAAGYFLSPGYYWAWFTKPTGYLFPTAGGDFWIILDRGATAPTGGNIQIEIKAAGTGKWVYSDDAAAWNVENTKAGYCKILGYTQAAQYAFSQGYAAFSASTFTGSGVDAIAYGTGTGISAFSSQGYGGSFQSDANSACKAYSYKSYAYEGNGYYGLKITTLNTNSQIFAKFFNASGERISFETDSLGFAYTYLKNSSGTTAIRFWTGGYGSFHSPSMVFGRGSDVAASAVLEADSTTKGFLPPRMTTAQRDLISSPATGLLIWNTTTAQLEDYNGSAWAAV